VAQHGAAIVQRLEHSDEYVRGAAVEVLGTSAEAVARHAPEVLRHTGAADDRVASFARSIVPLVQPATLASRLLLPDGGEAAFKPLGLMAEYAELLGRTVAADPALGELKAADGERYVDIACFECRRAMERALFLLNRFQVDSGPPLHFSATAAVVAATDQSDANRGTRCALKAMRDLGQVCAELAGRKGLDARYVVAVLHVYVDTSVEECDRLDEAAKQLGVTVERRDLEARLGAELAARSRGATGAADNGPTANEADVPSSTDVPADVSKKSKTSGYRFLLVLELADRNLTTTIIHDHIAGEDFFLIRKIAADLARALDHLHANGRIHADFKLLNAVRIASSWQLIDMDVSCDIGKPFGGKVPSSGYCPPEMARVLLGATDDSTGVVDTAKLCEYKASVAFDLWSFGVVFYHLIFGRPLWLTDQNDNVIFDDLRTLAGAAGAPPLVASLDKALYSGERRGASVDLAAASALLRKLLEPDPDKRQQHFAKTADQPLKMVLDEPFFQGQALDDATLNEIRAEQREIRAEQLKQTALLTAIDKRTVTIEGLQRSTIAQLDRHASNLRACIQAVADDTAPTAFVILSHRPGAKPEDSLLQEVQSELASATVELEATGAVVKQLFSGQSRGAAFLRCGRGMLSLYDRGTSAYSQAAGLAEQVRGAITDPKAFMLEQLKARAVETLYLCLVCELCWMPQPGEYEVTQQSEACRQVMPMAKATLSTIKALNGVAGIAQCFFPMAVPTVPRSVLQEMRATIDQFDAESSVVEFDEVQRVLEAGDAEGKREQGKQEGHCARQFKRLLEKEDPDHNWAQLTRMLLDEGKSVWVCACCREKVESNRSMSYAGLRELCTPDAVKNFRVEGADAVVATRLASADHVAAVSSSGAHDEMLIEVKASGSRCSLM